MFILGAPCEKNVKNAFEFLSRLVIVVTMVTQANTGMPIYSVVSKTHIVLIRKTV